MSYISDEQMRCIGVRGKDASWSLVELPIGPQALPPWAIGLHVEFCEHLASDPWLRLKTNIEMRNWPEQRFRREGDLWIAESEDGRAEAFYQGGDLKVERLRRWRHPDGALSVYAPIINNGTSLGPGEWIDIERLCTRQEQGFGGAHIDLCMIDGTEVTLRGPWHGPCPAGFVELNFTNVTCRYSRASHYRNKPWHQRGGGGICTVRAGVFLPIFARFAPHLRLASVDLGYGTRLQPLKPEWDEPKAWVQARKHMARKQTEFDAMKPEDRPPYVACEFPKACAGKTHCAVAECNHCTKRSA